MDKERLSERKYIFFRVCMSCVDMLCNLDSTKRRDQGCPEGHLYYYKNEFNQ